MIKRFFEERGEFDHKEIECSSKECRVRPKNSIADKLGAILTGGEDSRRVSVDGMQWHVVCLAREQQLAAKRGSASPKTRK
jgi:hypothetical protein